MSQHPGVEYTDIDQSLGRALIREKVDDVTTIVPGSLIWAKHLSRPLLGPEMLRIQMMPETAVSKGMAAEVSGHMMADLAGNAFTGTVFSAVVIAALLRAPVGAPADGHADADANAKAAESVLGL